jgi:lysophospholipase L1-like esterase
MSFLLGVLFAIIVMVAMQAGLYVVEMVRRPGLTVLSDRIDLDRIMQNDPDTFWSLQPNLKDVEFERQPGGPPRSFHVSTNELGLRNPPMLEKGGRFRVLAIGDSTTFGQYVEDWESWPSQLQELLDKDRREIDVVNAGLIGATSFQGLSYLLKRGFDLKPDAVIATYGFNDQGSWSIADRQGSALLSHERLGGVISAFVQRRQEHSPTPVARVSPGEFLDVLLIMARECEARGVALFLVLWPGTDQVTGDWNRLMSYQPLVLEAASRTHARIIDLRRPFHDSTEPVFVDIVHASPAGCRIAAIEVKAVLTASFPQLQLLSK